ncbi:MAG: hypothetical protein JWQ71_1002 [Pedosphaera sp.]|nr:hypothetical protein [Pedosphaera sp.]
MKRYILLFAMISLAALGFSGCGDSPESLVRKKLFSPSPDKDVTAEPYYNFSPFTNTVWKTKTRTAIADFKIYTGAHALLLLPPKGFDPTDPNYRIVPNLQVITVLPPGTRLRITRLMEDQGAAGSLWVEAVVEDGTKAPKAVSVTRDFLANIRFASTGPTTNTNWDVNPDMLEKVDSPPQP